MRFTCLTITLMIMLCGSGCVSYVAKQSWDKNEKVSAVRVQADGSRVMVGVDLGNLRYIKEHPFRATAAGVADGVIGYAVYKGVRELTDSGGSDSGYQDAGRDTTSVNVQGDGNTIQIRGDETVFGGTSEE